MGEILTNWILLNREKISDRKFINRIYYTNLILCR
jgi:hypothetical protein